MATPPTRRVPCTVTMLEDEGKGAIGGAVLGGLLAGPFGALFGSQLGASMGANARVRRGGGAYCLDGSEQETIKAAQEIAQELADAEQSLEIVRMPAPQRNLLEVVDRTMDDLYKAAEQPSGVETRQPPDGISRSATCKRRSALRSRRR